MASFPPDDNPFWTPFFKDHDEAEAVDTTAVETCLRDASAAGGAYAQRAGISCVCIDGTHWGESAATNLVKT